MSSKFNTDPTAKSERITRLVENLYRNMPEIEPDRAVLLTESYRETEGEPIIMRRARAFAHILAHIPITIREEELIVGSSTKAPRGCQTFPEFSYEWLEAEFDTIEKRSADPFSISEDTRKNCGKYINTGRGRQQVNSPSPIWRRKPPRQLNIISLRRATISITVWDM